MFTEHNLLGKLFIVCRPVVSCNYSRKPHIDPKSVPKPPKRPPTAYLEFFASHVKELKENNKGMYLLFS